MRSIDEEIARHLQDSLTVGELAQAPSFGKPFAVDDGWEETPEALRMPFKILKDAGIAPPEIQLFHERAALKERVKSEPEGPGREALLKKLSELEQVIALRLEALRSNAQL